MLLVVSLGVALGQWQLRRAAEKTAIERRLSARETAPVLALRASGQHIDELEYRHVVLRGEFVPQWTMYLDNRPYRGAAGVVVVTPFRLAGSARHVLVERGWIARDANERTRLPDIAAPAGEVTLAGMVRRNAGRLLQLGHAAPLVPGAFVQNLESAEFGKVSGLGVEDFVIEQSSDNGDGLVRDWPRPSSGVERHYGYAFQWYALAATAFLFFVVTGFRRATNKPASRANGQ